jgi:hypothetical protein
MLQDTIFGSTWPSVYWRPDLQHRLLVLAGTAILEIDATLLTVSPLGECRVWCKHFGQTHVRNRCSPVSDFAAANVGNMELSWSTERQLYGTSALQIFLLPDSCHPCVPACGRHTTTTMKLFNPVSGHWRLNHVGSRMAAIGRIF